MVVADIRATALYADASRPLDAPDVKRQRLGWRLWWGNPVAATPLLTASKSRVRLLQASGAICWHITAGRQASLFRRANRGGNGRGDADPRKDGDARSGFRRG